MFFKIEWGRQSAELVRRLAIAVRQGIVLLAAEVSTQATKPLGGASPHTGSTSPTPAASAEELGAHPVEEHPAPEADRDPYVDPSEE